MSGFAFIEVVGEGCGSSCYIGHESTESKAETRDALTSLNLVVGETVYFVNRGWQDINQLGSILSPAEIALAESHTVFSVMVAPASYMSVIIWQAYLICSLEDSRKKLSHWDTPVQNSSLQWTIIYLSLSAIFCGHFQSERSLSKQKNRWWNIKLV